MAGIPEVEELLVHIGDIHRKKNADYSAVGNPFENFERAAELIGWFHKDLDKTFVNHIATKLARLATLLNAEVQPKNESIEDSFLDLCTYCILWSSHYKGRRAINYSLVDAVTVRETGRS